MNQDQFDIVLFIVTAIVCFSIAAYLIVEAPKKIEKNRSDLSREAKNKYMRNFRVSGYIAVILGVVGICSFIYAWFIL